MILGGGAGTRLFPLTAQRAKPAVPLAGKYRLVDVRSKSRVGRGDVGANAKRVRQYLERLRAANPAPIQTETSK